MRGLSPCEYGARSPLGPESEADSHVGLVGTLRRQFEPLFCRDGSSFTNLALSLSSGTEYLNENALW